MNICAICGGDLNTGGRCVKCALSHNITHVPINPQIAHLEAELTALRREVAVLKRALENEVRGEWCHGQRNRDCVGHECKTCGIIQGKVHHCIAQATAEIDKEAADDKG